MKLVLITAVREFEKEIKQILKQSGVISYSYQHVIGHTNTENEESNWFGSSTPEVESVLFYAFVKADKVSTTLQAINDFNNQQQTLSHIHTALMTIENN